MTTQNRGLQTQLLSAPRLANSYTSLNRATVQPQNASFSHSPRTNTFYSTSDLTETSIPSLRSQTIRMRNKPNLNDDLTKRKRQSDPMFQFQSMQPLSVDKTLFRVQSQRSLDYNTKLTKNSKIKPEGKRIFVVRHAERVDSTFGVNWVEAVFDRDGKYRRLNLNLPKVIPVRRNPKDFIFDPPLTELGLMQSRLIGEELQACGVDIEFCYSSPALRCIQTASKILEGLGRKDILLRIEPCLFEFLKWHPVMPSKSPFMEKDELCKNGYKIDCKYQTMYPLETLRKDEDENMYYTRSHTVMLQIIRNHDCNDANILVIGHAPTLEVATRQLTGGAPRVNDLRFLVRQIPYLAIQTVECQPDGTWKLKKPPIPPLKHAALQPFDWRHIR